MYLHHVIEAIGSIEITRVPAQAGPHTRYAVTIWPMPETELYDLEPLLDVGRRELAALGVQSGGAGMEETLAPLDAWDAAPDGRALRAYVAEPVPGAARLDNVLGLVAAYEAGRSHAVLAFQELAEAGRPAVLDPVPSGVGVPKSPFAAFAYRLGWRFAIEAANP